MSVLHQFRAAAPLPEDSRDVLVLRCPRCASTLQAIARTTPPLFENAVRCSTCDFRIEHERGIWVALPPERARHYEQFMKEYQIVRAGEGRGSTEADFYLALPYRDVSGRNQAQWNIRAQTFRCLEKHVIRQLSRDLQNSSLDVLDLGAGNGWLSYRLALAGHRPVAIDLLTNNADGLGAAAHYLQKLHSLFPRFQAENDKLPFADSQFDCIIFNASFHYSEDSRCTVGEAVRCLRPGGALVIADSPWYQKDESGQRMLQEKHEAFKQRFGFPSDGLKSMEYLTDESLEFLERQFDFHWTFYQPNYGIGWAMRPLIAQLKGQREPSKFRIYVARVTR